MERPDTEYQITEKGQELAAKLGSTRGVQNMMGNPIMSSMKKSPKRTQAQSATTPEANEKRVKNLPSKDPNFTTIAPGRVRPLKVRDSVADILAKMYNFMVRKALLEKKEAKENKKYNKKIEDLKEERNKELIGLFKVKKKDQNISNIKPKKEPKPKEEKGVTKPLEKMVSKKNIVSKEPAVTAEKVSGTKSTISKIAIGAGAGAAITIAGLGSASAKFESNGDPSTVSSGKGDPGGVSYGTYQMSSTKGVADDFVRKSEWKDQFAGKKAGTPDFSAKWKEIAKDPKQSKKFADAQHDYIKKTHFDPAASIAKKMGYKVEDPGVADAIWSLSVQHGNVSGVLGLSKKNMGGTVSPDPKTEIISLYKARDEYTRGLGMNLSKRYDEEVKYALKKAGTSPEAESQASTPPVETKVSQIPDKEKKTGNKSKSTTVSVLNNNTNIVNGGNTYGAPEDKKEYSPLIEKQFNYS